MKCNTKCEVKKRPRCASIKVFIHRPKWDCNHELYASKPRGTIPDLCPYRGRT